jgi:hypothetical protein
LNLKEFIKRLGLFRNVNLSLPLLEDSFVKILNFDKAWAKTLCDFDCGDALRCISTVVISLLILFNRICSILDLAYTLLLFPLFSPREGWSLATKVAQTARQH